jgi:hypothetical protein
MTIQRTSIATLAATLCLSSLAILSPALAETREDSQTNRIKVEGVDNTMTLNNYNCSKATVAENSAVICRNRFNRGDVRVYRHGEIEFYGDDDDDIRVIVPRYPNNSGSNGNIIVVPNSSTTTPKPSSPIIIRLD